MDVNEVLKQKISRYLQLKETVKDINKEVKELDNFICETMSERGLTSIKLPDGSEINYQVKESLSVKKKKD